MKTSNDSRGSIGPFIQFRTTHEASEAQPEQKSETRVDHQVVLVDLDIMGV